MRKIFKEATRAVLVLFVLLAPNVMAQEVLVPMRGNASLSSYDEYMRAEMANPSRAVGDTLSLPFFDDFSEPFSRLRTAADLFPNSGLWVDNKAYINNHMAINPISQGVATFDGLDERGRAYGFLLQGQSPSPQPADSLTSKPIDLSNAADTVYLSFYYQPQGAAPYAPGEEYKLVLEFKDTADLWETQWEAEGFDLEIFDFNRVMVPVSDERYLYSGFQFRFRNYTFLGGNVDQWHIDYVKLDEGRDINDTALFDVAQLCQTSYIDTISAFQSATYSLLKEYAAMPWTHYKADSVASTGDSAYFMLRNNTNIIATPNFSLQVYDHLGVQRFDVLSRTASVFPDLICGNESNTCNVIGGSTNFEFDISSLITSFPGDQQISDDSTFFALRFNVTFADDNPSNSVRVEKQEFYNYYAYDDGTAEAAYGLENLENESMVALKYNIKKLGDRLVGIQYYLNPVEFDMEDEPVRLVVWSGNEEPEDILWQSPDTNLYYTNQRNYFHNYTINDTVLNIASENIWIGWVQQPSTNPEFGFSFGFDKRTDASSKLRLNLGSSWNQSSIPGAVMLRPVFGEPYDWVSVTEKPSMQHVKVYPNPTTGDVFLEETVSGQFSSAKISVFDLSGRSVYTTTGYTGKLQLGHLNAGTYLLRIDAADGVFTERLVLQL